MIDLSEVGAFASDPTSTGLDVHFGIYLPGIGANLQVVVIVIHSADRFTPGVPAQQFALDPVGGPNGLWAKTVTIVPQPGTNFGQAGRYLYRYQLRHNAPGAGVVTPWFTDPFARTTDDVGQLSAFDTPGSVSPFEWHDVDWKVPELADLVVYELHVEEFNTTFGGVVDRLPYLKSLGVSCLELMPISSLKLDFDWGYGPLHFIAPNERWGGAGELKRLVDTCHSNGVAVILDVVFQHVDPSFPYNQVYLAAGSPSPMVGPSGPYGPEIDFDQQFARDYLNTVIGYLLDEYHVDGFRYDEVTDLYDGPTGIKYASLAFNTYNASLGLARFTPSGRANPGEYSRIIQVAEELNLPQEILRSTYSSATWQDALLNKAEDMTRWHYLDDSFAHLLDADFSGYPRVKTVHDGPGNPVDMPVAPFQYLNTHDHSHLITFLAGNPQDPYQPTADRSAWYKIQPFVIALYTAAGIPMLWQGQEVSDNYVLADGGDLRIHFQRNVHWEYFYDPDGAPLVRLHRILADLRSTCPGLRSRDSYYYNTTSDTTAGIIGYRRGTDADLALVFLNFSDNTQSMTVPFPAPGTYRERVDNGDRSTPLDIVGAAGGDPMTVTVPSNYGYVFTKIP